MDSSPLKLAVTPEEAEICFVVGDRTVFNLSLSGWEQSSSREILCASGLHSSRDTYSSTCRGGSDSSFLPDNSFQLPRNVRSQQSNVALQSNIPRPLSSADEAGPVPKRLRSTTTRIAPESKPKSSSNKGASDELLKKARARPALLYANVFSSSHSQPATTSRAHAALTKIATQSNLNAATRRSNRLQSGSGTKQLHLAKVRSLSLSHFGCNTHLTRVVVF